MPIIIDVAGPQGNAFAIMGAVQKVLRQLDKTPDEIKVIMDDMKSGDYEHLKAVATEATHGLIEFME